MSLSSTLHQISQQTKTLQVIVGDYTYENVEWLWTWSGAGYMIENMCSCMLWEERCSV